jgi:PHD/YefM family antitoxin component YafN of YafNO toxin-antitoxin module
MDAKDLKKASGGKKKDLTNKLTKQAKEQKNRVKIRVKTDGSGFTVVRARQKNRVKMDETEYLLSTKANRDSLLATIEDMKNGNNEGSITFESIEAIKKHYGL